MGGKRIYNVNENYFDSWNQEMAYVLGFISADGCIETHRRTLSIELQERDVEILEFIRQQIAPDAPIKYTKKKDKIYRKLRICSVKLVKSLEQYNIVPAKTYTMKLGFHIPASFLGDYFRGLFDGDGCVQLRRNSIETSLVSHTREYLDQLRELFPAGQIHVKQTQHKSGVCSTYYVWQMYKKDSLKLRDIMYSSGGFSLQRKRNAFYSEFYKPSPVWWTEEQINLLKQNYIRGTSIQDIANLVGKSYKSVASKIDKLQLSAQCKTKSLDDTLSLFD